MSLFYSSAGNHEITKVVAWALMLRCCGFPRILVSILLNFQFIYFFSFCIFFTGRKCVKNINTIYFLKKFKKIYFLRLTETEM